MFQNLVFEKRVPSAGQSVSNHPTVNNPPPNTCVKYEKKLSARFLFWILFTSHEKSERRISTNLVIMSAICCSSYVVQPISHQQTIMMTEGYHHYSNAVSGHYHDFAVPRPNDGLLLHQQRQSSSKRLEEALVRAIPRASSGKVSQV